MKAAKASKAKKSSPNESLDLLTGLAQKINAPLRSVFLSSQKLIDIYKEKNFEYVSYKDFKQILSTLEQMNRQIKRCYETSQRLTSLNSSKDNNESSNINGTIDDILKLFKQQFLSCRIKVYFHPQKDIPKVALSLVDGHQIMHNVLTSAIQVMPNVG